MPPPSGIGRINWKYAFFISVIALVLTVQFLFLHGNTVSTSSTTESSTASVAASVGVKQPIATDPPPHQPGLQQKKPEPSQPRPSHPETTQVQQVVPSSSVTNVATVPSKANSLDSSLLAQGNVGRLLATPMSWEDFVHLPYNEHFEKPTQRTKIVQSNLITCPASVVDALAKPRLPEEDLKWCKWAISPNGGKVVVGKSWGNLKTKEQKEKFDALNCNSVNEGKNPSCDDSWGDIHIRTWQKNRLEGLRCSASKSSDMLCYKNDNNDVYCSIKNAQINFAKARKVSRGGNTPSKKFQNDFLSADCKDHVAVEDAFPFPHLYSPSISSSRCDYVYNGTLLMYSHDDIRNLGHTLNDVFNIWIMLWMQGIARYEHQIEMLNIDSFKLGHNFDDQPNAFFTTYYKALRGILKGIDFGEKTLCVKELMVQPIPPRFFIWESWFVDLPCSFLGPSSLYQRWNLDVRNNYGFLNRHAATSVTTGHNKRKVLLIIRNEHSNMWGSQRTSRNFLNTPEIVRALQQLIENDQVFQTEFEFVGMDLSKLSFEEQLSLIGETGLMIGMHGAGIASSMHMPIGEPKCCGVLEIFPQGEFTPIKGHGNMARKMGLHFDRLDIPAAQSQGNGAHVPIGPLTQQVRTMLHRLLEQPTCVLDAVINDPYLEASHV